LRGGVYRKGGKMREGGGGSWSGTFQNATRGRGHYYIGKGQKRGKDVSKEGSIKRKAPGGGKPSQLKDNK